MKHFSSIVVGSDIYAMHLYHRLCSEEDTVLLIGEPRPHFSGPTPLRGKDNIAAFKAHFPSVPIKEQKNAPKFLKEGEFHSFGGRTKPAKLLYCEEFFTQTGAYVEPELLFPWLKAQEFLHHTRRGPVSAIEPGYKIVCGSEEFSCGKLFWGNSLGEFRSCYKGDLPWQDTRQEIFLQQVQVKFHFSGVVSNSDETLFFPISYSHEEGHFIGEFREQKGVQDGGQVAEFICFVDPKECSEEEIIKRIRRLQRNLEKTFSSFKGYFIGKKITVVPIDTCLNIDDYAFGAFDSNNKSLFFIGQNAPITGFCNDDTSFQYSPKNISFLTRAMLSLQDTSSLN